VHALRDPGTGRQYLRVTKTVDDLLEEVRGRYERVLPEQASDEQQAGAILVDTRSYEQRREHGLIPGAVLMERNVMEWRLDPASDAHESWIEDHDVRVIVVCQQGFGSSLAVRSLLDMGLARATDLIGGFEAWRVAGLPVDTHSPEGDEQARHGPTPGG
jgi:rhodanese-related sulfurtransferase